MKQLELSSSSKEPSKLELALMLGFEGPNFPQVLESVAVTLSLDGHFSAPTEAWMLKSLDELSTFEAGRTPATKDPSFWTEKEGTPFVSIGDMPRRGRVAETGKYISRKALQETFRGNVLPAGTLIMSFKLSIGKIAFLDVPAVHNEAIVNVVPNEEVRSRYLYWVLPELARSGDTVNAVMGKTLNRESLKRIEIRFPSVSEQDQLCDAFERRDALVEALAKKESRKSELGSRLTKASLEALTTAETPEEFALAWKRVSENFDTLIDRSEKVEDLRKAIVLAGVDGVLTGTRRAGWRYASLTALGRLARGKSKHRPRNDPALFVDGKYRVIQTGDVARSEGRIRTWTSLYGDVGLAQSELWPAGTVCITIAANIGDTGLLTFDACFPDSIVGFIPNQDHGVPEYFEYFLRTLKDRIEKLAPATAQKNINLQILSDLRIAVPSKNEQIEIVRVIEILMKQCDALEASLLRAERLASEFAESVVRGVTA